MCPTRGFHTSRTWPRQLAIVLAERRSASSASHWSSHWSSHWPTVVPWSPVQVPVFSRASTVPSSAYDNAMAESVFVTLKTELVYRRSWASRHELEMEVFSYLEGFYNPRRRHSRLGNLSPADYETQHLTRNQASAQRGSLHDNRAVGRGGDIGRPGRHRSSRILEPLSIPLASTRAPGTPTPSKPLT